MKCTVYPKKYAHGFCFAVLCCGYTLTDFPISIRLTSLALWQSNDCPSASKATLMNMDKYFMWIHYERLHNHNKAKHNKTCVHISWDILYKVVTIWPQQNKAGQNPCAYFMGCIVKRPQLSYYNNWSDKFQRMTDYSKLFLWARLIHILVMLHSEGDLLNTMR